MGFLECLGLLAFHSHPLRTHLSGVYKEFKRTHDTRTSVEHLQKDEVLKGLIPPSAALPLPEAPPLCAIKKVFDKHRYKTSTDLFSFILINYGKSHRRLYERQKELLEIIEKVEPKIINALTPEIYLFLPDGALDRVFADLEGATLTGLMDLMNLRKPFTSQDESRMISEALSRLKEEADKVYTLVSPHLKNIEGIPAERAQLFNEKGLMQFKKNQDFLNLKFSEERIRKTVSINLQYFLPREIFKNSGLMEILSKAQGKVIAEWKKGKVKSMDEEFFSLIGNEIERAEPTSPQLVLENNEEGWQHLGGDVFSRAFKGDWGA